MSSKCFVPGCKTGYESTRRRVKELGIKNPSLFSVPKDPVLFEKWKNIIPEGRHKLRKRDRICERHFHEDDIERYYVTNLPDGSCCKIERGIPKLKDGVVPHMFSNLQGQLSDTCVVTNKTFSCISRDTACTINEECVSNDESPNSNSRFQKENESFSSISSDEACSNNEQPVTNDETANINCLSRFQKQNKTLNYTSSDKAYSINEQPATNDEIVKINFLSRFQKEYETFKSISSDTACNIKEKPVINEERVETNYLSIFQKGNEIQKFKRNSGSIQVPDEWWGINSTPEFIVCTKWNDNYSPERRVIIEKDLNVKIFIKDYEVPTDETLNHSSFEDISRLLNEVNAYKICPGIDDKSLKNCLKYDKFPQFHGRFFNWCKNCQKTKQSLWRKEQNRRRNEFKKFKRSKCFACFLTKDSLKKRIHEKSSPDTSIEPSLQDEKSSPDTSIEPSLQDEISSPDTSIEPSLQDEKSSPYASIEPSVDVTADSTVMNDYIVLAECLITGN